ncbi:MAG: class I SAM-dependent methyltransferase [Myxococcota bacterium]
MESLNEDGPRSLEHFVEISGAKSELLEQLMRIACMVGIVENDEDLFFITRKGHAFFHSRGFFTWAAGGYGRFFGQLAELARSGGDASTCRPLIDGSQVAVASNLCNLTMMREHCLEALEPLEFSRIADLGCGNAGRLIDICNRYHAVSGMGIDINAHAIESARELVRRNDMQHRIELHQTDALSVESIEGVHEVDLVMSFLMMHDLFNARRPAEVVSGLLSAFPNARHFVVADTFQMPAAQSITSAPIFSLGFELVHGFMGIRLYRPEDYIAEFCGQGMTLAHRSSLGAPHTDLLVFER